MAAMGAGGWGDRVHSACRPAATQYFDEQRPLVIDGLEAFSLDLKALFEP